MSARNRSSSFGRNLVLGPVLRFLGRLRFRSLFILAGLLFAFDAILPDVIPFVDEILLAVLTLILGALKIRENDPASDDELLDLPESAASAEPPDSAEA